MTTQSGVLIAAKSAKKSGKRNKNMSEQQLVNECKSYLNSRGCFVWRNNSGVTRSFYKGRERMWRSGVRGASDIIGVFADGRFIAIECKVGYNKPTPHQTEFINEVKSRGGIAGVVKSLDELIVLIDPIYVKNQ